MPEAMSYDPATLTVHVGAGQVRPVTPEVWAYEVGGMNVLKKWFGYRKRKPAGKRTSPLDDINPVIWSPDYTTDLLALLNVLGRLVELEPTLADLLDRVLAGPLVTMTDLHQAGVLPPPPDTRKPAKPGFQPRDDGQETLL